MATLIDSYSESNVRLYYPLAGGDSGTPFGAGNSFTNTSEIILDNAIFYLKIYQGNPTGTAVAKIYAHSGTYGTSSVATGSALATSDSYNVAGLTSSAQLITFNFTGENKITLNASTYYVAIVEYSGLDFSNCIAYGFDDTTPTHSGNKVTKNSADDSIFMSIAGHDAIFYVYGDETATTTTTTSTTTSTTSTSTTTTTTSTSSTSSSTSTTTAPPFLVAELDIKEFKPFLEIKPFKPVLEIKNDWRTGR